MRRESGQQKRVRSPRGEALGVAPRQAPGGLPAPSSPRTVKISEFGVSGLSSRSIRDAHEEIVDEFEFLDDWMDRYQHIVDVGRKLPPYPSEFRTDAYKVRGCQAQVWFHADERGGRLFFEAVSDAAIVSGLIALLLRAYSGFTPREILDAGHEFIDRIGLTEHLSPTRGNGLHAMLRTIRNYAAASLQRSQALQERPQAAGGSA